LCVVLCGYFLKFFLMGGGGGWGLRGRNLFGVTCLRGRRRCRSYR
jgi:hypothetical protein